MNSIVLSNCFTKLFLSYLFDEPKKCLFLTNSKLMLLGESYPIPTYKYSIFISFFALLNLTVYKFYLYTVVEKGVKLWIDIYSDYLLTLRYFPS